jgi:multiple sugar transport system substrate-binding protein
MNARKMSRREMLKWSAMTAGGALLAACSTATPTVEAPAEAPTQAVANIKFMMWAWSPENEAFERDRVDRFNKAQPAVVVEPIIMPYEDLWTKLDIQVASGEAPDSVWYDYAAYPLIAKGEFIDLKPYVDLEPDMMNDAVYDQNFWTAAKMLGDAQILSLPIGGEGMNLFYNLNLFDEAGVDYPTDEFTWDDFLSVAQKLTKTEGDKTTQFGTSLATMQAWWAWPLLVNSKGKDILDSRTRPTKCLVDSEEAVQSLQFMQDLIYKLKVAPDPAQASVLADQGGDFGSGQVAMFLDGAWDVVGFRGIDRFKWDIGLLPIGSAGRPSPFWIGGPMVARQSKYPDASWAWARWTAEKEGEELIAKSGQQVTWLRSARDLTVDGAVPEHYSNRFKTLENIIPADVWTAAWNEILDKVWNPEFDKFWQGQITAEELAATITPKTDELLK